MTPVHRLGGRASHLRLAYAAPGPGAVRKVRITRAHIRDVVLFLGGAALVGAAWWLSSVSW